MPQYGSWEPYSGSEAVVLGLILLLMSAVLAFLGLRLNNTLRVARPGKAVTAFLLLIWVLALLTFLVAVVVYGTELYRQVSTYTPPVNPIAPVTFLAVLVTFIVLLWMCKPHGWKVALGSAIVGTIAAPLIFELLFDLIVMGRVYSPAPASLYHALFFFPLFLVEISTFALLTLSPLFGISRYTLFSLAGMFLVFVVWGFLGFAYPAAPLPTACNAIAKILSFVTAVTLFLPQKATSENPLWTPKSTSAAS